MTTGKKTTIAGSLHRLVLRPIVHHLQALEAQALHLSPGPESE